jgi:hypothetical protein
MNVKKKHNVLNQLHNDVLHIKSIQILFNLNHYHFHHFHIRHYHLLRYIKVGRSIQPHQLLYVQLYLIYHLTR